LTRTDEQVAAIIVKAVVETKGTQGPKSELVMKIEMQLMTCVGLAACKATVRTAQSCARTQVRENQLMGCYGQSQGQFQLSANFTM